MNGPIGYYVHHHGTGHLTRALAIARQSPAHFVLLGTGFAGRTGEILSLDLPDDRTPAVGRQDDLPHALHYAPLGCDGLRQRAAALTGWIATTRPALFVVDVSVEAAMLARLAATPVVYVRLAGRRVDPAHLEAFRGARALLAPFHEALDEPDVADWIRRKTRYVPGLTEPMPDVPPQAARVLLVLGTGGTALTGSQLVAAAAATPALQWRVIGPAPGVEQPPPNLTCLGWIENATAEIAAAGIVIGGAGDGVVNAVLAAGRPFICVPQARPFDEQLVKARRLAAIGAAVTLEAWPAEADWPEIIAQVLRLAPGAARQLHDPDGLRRAAAFLLECAA